MTIRKPGLITVLAALFALALAGGTPAMAQSDGTQGTDGTTGSDEKPADDDAGPPPEPDC